MREPSESATQRSARSAAAAGGESLSARLVVRALRRCLPMLRPVRADLARFALAVAVLGVIGAAAGALLLDLHWTRVLKGEPLSPLEARLLGLDPATSVHVEALSAEIRRSVRDRELALGVALTLLLAPLGGALAYYLLWILQRINQGLRLELFQRLQTLSLRFHHESRVGDAIYRLYQDSAMVTDLIQTLLLGPLAQVLRFVTATALIALLDAQLALLLLLAWPPSLLLAALLTPRLRRGFRQARAANSALTSQIQETLAGIRVIKAYGAEAREQARFEARSREAFAAAFSARSSFAALGVLSFGLVATALLAATGIAALRTQQGLPLFAQRILLAAGFSAWNLGLFSFSKAAFGASTQAIERLLVLWARAQDIAVGLDRVFELLDVEPEVRDAPDAMPLAPPRHGIAYHGVGFGYRPGRPVLADVSFEAPCGAVTALLGPTGAGKSTLLSLLLRLFDPDTGRIEIDGVDLRRLQLASLRAGVALALAGEPALRRHGAREHPACEAGRERRRSARSRPRRLRGRLHLRAAAGLRHAARRARRQALDGAAAAHFDRAGRAQGRADPRARRADRLARRRDRKRAAPEPDRLGA